MANILVVGAGNAGRPVARLLNYLGHDILLVDKKNFEEFPSPAQDVLRAMEKEGVELQLGSDTPTILEGIKMAYISPTIPPGSPALREIQKSELKVISNQGISSIIDDVLGLDIIGVTGTLGKTTTTHIISHLLKEAGYKVWTCSSLHGNLLSETIVDGIVKGQHLENEVGVMELPHGTLRLMSQVQLTVGILTNIYPEHLAEFGGSMEKYVARKLIMAKISDTFITTPQCRDIVASVRNDTLYYGMDCDKCHFSGSFNGDTLKFKYEMGGPRGYFKTNFPLRGYYRENAVAGAAATICYGLDPNIIKEGLGTFKGIRGRIEYLGEYCNRRVYFDAAYLPEGMRPTLDFFKEDDLVILIDNPDSSTPRDKPGIGRILGEYAKTVICSGYNETMKVLDMSAAEEVLNGVENPNVIKIAVEDMETAGELAIKYSQPGDTILHVGPGAVSAYEEVKSAIIRGLKRGCKY